MEDEISALFPEDFESSLPIAVPASELLSEVADGADCRVREVSRRALPEGEFREYEISAHERQGERVVVSLRLCLADPSQPNLVFSIPGGGGAFPDDILVWLARTNRRNYAAVDWIGRGKSPEHRSVRCLYDPLYMADDDYRSSFMYHNTIAIWAAVNWLFKEGFAPTAVVGGSWGGVYSFLLSCLDARIERIYSTFGCGGFCLPQVERRNFWDDALHHMGPRKAATWFAAFDPLLRLLEQQAATYLESATNDKYFSLDMVQETWRRVRRKNGFALALNQDHEMRPHGLQPYRMEALDFAGVDCEPARQASRLSVSWEPGSNTVIAWPVKDASRAALVWAEQRADAPDMSRDWRRSPPRTVLDNAAIFTIEPTSDRTAITYYVETLTSVGGLDLRTTTPVFRNTAEERGYRPPGTFRPTTLWSAREREFGVSPIGAEIGTAPGGKGAPPLLEARDGLVDVRFRGSQLSRVSIFGIRSWLLPQRWRELRLRFAPSDAGSPVGLACFIAANFHRFDEVAAVQALSEASTRSENGEQIVVLPRNGFRPAATRQDRFGNLDRVARFDVCDRFDAVGLIDMEGKCHATIGLKSVEVA